jgi:hypothetical protein
MSKNIEINVNTDSEGVRNLRSELKEAVREAQSLAAAGKANTAEYDAALAKAGELRDIIGDTNTQISALATGSKFEQLGNNLGNVGDKLRNLNFAGAASDAKVLVNVSKSLTFKEATAGITDLGKTFLSLGKALLTNPLFLLAAVIVGIVVAIVKLMDKLGVLKTITEAVGKVFEWFGSLLDSMADQIAKVSDALFGTELQAAKTAQQVNDQLDKIQSRLKDRNSEKERELDRQIKLNQAEGKSTRELEQEKLKLIAANIGAERMALQIKLKNAEKYNLLTKEQLDELKKQLKETNQAYKDAVVDVKAFDKKSQKEDDDKAKENAEKARQRAKENALKAKQYAQDRLNAERMIEDARLSLIADDEQRELKVLDTKYKRLIEDTKKNEKLLDSEKTAFIKELELQRQKEETKLQEGFNKKRLEEEKKFLGLIAQLTQGELSPAEKLKKEYEDKLKALEDGATEEQKKRQEYQDAILAIEKNYADAQEKLRLEVAEKEKAERDKRDKEELAAKLTSIEVDKAIRDAKISIAQDGTNGLAAIGQAFIQDQRKLEKFNKATALVQIGIDTARAISALVAASQANPLNAATAGIAGAAQFASGIVQIVTNIAKAKQILSNPGASAAASSGGGSSPSTGSSLQTSVQQAAPQFNLFGTAGNFNQQSSGGNNNNQMNVSVSVEEINSVQNKVAKIKEMSTL